MDEHASKEEKILILLTRIDDRSLSTLDQLVKLNSKVADHEKRVQGLELTDAENSGRVQVTGKFSSALMSVASSVVAVMILWWIGLRK